MRNLLLAPVLASFVLSSAPAEACGPYTPEPTLFKLSTHAVRSGTRLVTTTTRTFVLTDTIDRAQADRLAWQPLAPGTYDYARMALAPDLAQPIDLTLIGPGGTKVVSSKRRAFLDRTFAELQPSSALEVEVERGKFAFAIAGRHARAKWISLDDRGTTAADLAWVEKQGVTVIDPQYVQVAKLAGTHLVTISVLTKDGMVTMVRSGHALYAQFAGTTRGAVEVDGQRFAVAMVDNAVTAIWL